MYEPQTICIRSPLLTTLQGPVTTTFTPAPSCSGPYNVEIGRYEEVPIDDTTSVSSSLAWIGSPCENTGARFANCIPSGSVVDSQFSAFWTRPSPVPTRRFAIDYYSPGFICPSGYSTVGVATKSTGGSVSSSGPAFVPRSADPWVIENVLEDVTPNVLLQSLDEGESAVLCCPRFAFCIRTEIVTLSPGVPTSMGLITADKTLIATILWTSTGCARPSFLIIPSLHRYA